jgi:hypothetical protein
LKFALQQIIHYTAHRLILGPRGPALDDILGSIGVSERIFTIVKTFFQTITEKYKTIITGKYKNLAKKQPTLKCNVKYANK